MRKLTPREVKWILFMNTLNFSPVLKSDDLIISGSGGRGWASGVKLQ
jgi:hypothetical protein